MNQRPLRMLLADDETSLREPLAKHLRQAYGYQVDTAATAQEILERLAQAGEGYDVALIDDLLLPAAGQEPEPLGADLTRTIKARCPHTEIIVFTGWGMDSALDALRAGAYRYLAKPFNLEELGLLIQTAAEHSRLKGVAQEKKILENFMETSTALLSSQDLSRVLNTILQGVQAIGFDRVRLYLLASDGQTMVGHAQVGMEVNFVGFEFPVAKSDRVKALLANRQPQLFKRGDGETLEYDEPLARADVDQWVCVPLLLYDEFIGMLAADNKLSQRPIGEAVLGPMALFAAQAAAAIANTRLRINEQEARRQAEQRAHNLAVIQEVATTINSSLDLDQILTRACRAAVDLFQVDHSGIVLFDRSLQRGRVVAEYPGLGTRGVVIPVSGIEPEEALVNNQTPLIIHDVARRPDLETVGDILTRFDIRSLVIVPVIFKGQVLGSFSLDSIKQTRDFSRDDVNLCQVLAAQLAVAIENAQTHQQVRQYADRLEVLQEIDADLDTATGMAQILASIARHIVRLVEARRSLFIIIDPDNKAIKATGRGYPPNHIRRMSRQEMDDGISGWVMRTKKAALVENAQADPRNTGLALANAKKFDTGPLIVAPLLVKGQVIGTLTAANPLGTAPFTPEDRSLVLMLANQAASAIENMRLLRETEQRGQLLLALDEASRHIRAEKEVPKLLQEIVRLAAELIGCTIGGLFTKHPQLSGLTMEAAYGLPETLVGHRVSQSEGVVGHVARSGEPHIVAEYLHWVEREPIFEPLRLHTVLAVPLRQNGTVEAVLLVADRTGSRQFSKIDLEILDRFAVKAALASQTARLISREQRMYAQLSMLHRISNYIQAAGDLDNILHVVLTGVTAGYGLSFNRAALLLRDPNGDSLVGRMGIGHLNEQAARSDWEHDVAGGVYDLERYLALLEQDELPLTPIGKNIREVCVPIEPEPADVFSKVVQDKRYLLATAADLRVLPPDFVAAFEPALPCIIVPLLARDQVIGLLVADNKFTKRAIAREEIESLLTFANTAAIAIDNTLLLEAATVAQERLGSFFLASNALVSAKAPEAILQEIVEQARVTAAASGVTMFLVDKAGEVQNLVSVGVDERFTAQDVGIRPDGLSMGVIDSGQPAIIEDVHRLEKRANPSMFGRGIVAGLCLPVALEGKRIGVMWVHYSRPRTFSESEIEALQLYVNQAAIAFDSARRIKELELMRQAAEALAGVAELPEVLRQIVESAREVLQGDSAVILSYDPVQDKFVPESSVVSGIPEQRWKDSRKSEPRRGGTVYTIMEQGWIGITDIDDAQNLDFLGRSTRTLLQQIGARSFQGFALEVDQEKLGVLYVNYDTPHHFSSAEQETAQTFANHAALALKKARLLAQVGKARNAAKVVAEVTTLEDIEATLKSVAEGTMDALGCDAVTLYGYDPRKNKLLEPPIAVGVRYPERAEHLAALSSHHNIVFEILRRDQLYIAENAPADALFKDRRFTHDEQIASCVGIPLTVGAQKVGVMFVNYRTQHRFTTDELANIGLFANQAAVAIRNAQLYEQVQRRAKILQTLYEAGKVVGGSLELEEVLHRIVAQAPLVTKHKGRGPGFASIRTIDGLKSKLVSTYPEETWLKVKEAGQDEIDLAGGQNGRIGVAGRAAISGEAQLVNDIRTDPDYLELHPETRSELAVPIKEGDKVISVINVEHPEQNAFDEDDLQALQSLAAQVSIIIQNAQLYRQVSWRWVESNALRQVAVSLAGASGLTAVLDVIMAEAMKLTRTEGGRILLWDNRTKKFTRTFRKDRGGKLEPYRTTARTSGGLTREIIDSQRPVVIPDAGQDPRSNPVFIARGHRATIGVPLLCQPRGIGVLYVHSHEPREFTDRQVKLLEALAGQAALAIDRASQYEELERTKGLVGGRTALAWMGMVSSAWRHAIEGHAMTIREEIQNLRHVASPEYLPQAEAKLRTIERLAEEIMDKPITPPLPHEEGAQSVLVNALVQERIQQLWENMPYRSVKVRLDLARDQAVTVRATPEWLRQIIDVLVDNAIEAMAEVAAPELAISSRRHGNEIRIEFADTGPGIPPDIRPRLFNEKIEKSPDTPGLGMGLLMAQTIAQTYGGEIRIQASSPAGTTMVVVLPLEIRRRETR